MTEPTVQVPVSLARAIVGQLRNDAEQIDGEWGWNRDVSKIRASSDPDDYGKEQVRLSDALDALLSQPTPTAEPPRIEDMAPGTQFTAQYRMTGRRALFAKVGKWSVVEVAVGALTIHGAVLDPSTIRDVTSPAVTE